LWLTDLFLTMSGVILICVLGVSALHGQSWLMSSLLVHGA
jgi:hypothetical protein